MEAIWRAWEHLRLEPALGVSTWWLNHADPHMRLLMDKEGSLQEMRPRRPQAPTRPRLRSAPAHGTRGRNLRLEAISGHATQIRPGCSLGWNP